MQRDSRRVPRSAPGAPLSWLGNAGDLAHPLPLEKHMSDSLDLAALIPEHFGRYFAFFKPGHIEGIVPARIKELARLKIAALNQCDT